jgi:hypothetical protein
MTEKTHSLGHTRDRSPRGPDISSALAGVAGGLVGSLLMNIFARAAAAMGGGSEAPGAAPGPDRSGRGAQPPQALGAADEDAATLSGAKAYELVTGERPEPEVRPYLGTAAHYAFGAGMGLLYGVMATRAPVIRTCGGTLYGTLVWAVGDEGIVPALGLSKPPQQVAPAVHVYSLLAHFVYGAALEVVWDAASGPH